MTELPGAVLVELIWSVSVRPSTELTVAEVRLFLVVVVVVVLLEGLGKMPMAVTRVARTTSTATATKAEDVPLVFNLLTSSR